MTRHFVAGYLPTVALRRITARKKGGLLCDGLPFMFLPFVPSAPKVRWKACPFALEAFGFVLSFCAGGAAKGSQIRSVWNLIQSMMRPEGTPEISVNCA